jgi:DNA polymerase-1
MEFEKEVFVKCLVIDSHYLCHRAKHTTNFMSYNGGGTGVLFGFFNELLKASKQFTPDIFVFAWDSRSSIRKKKYPFYKTRKTDKDYLTEEELKAEKRAHKQFTLLRKEILPTVGFNNVLLQKGLEADDIIAKLVMNKKYHNINFLVETADNDLHQLLDYCRIYNPQKDMVLTDDLFVSLRGIPPKDWAKVKAIAGCTSDTVPGVNGVGDKLAVKYLRGEMKDTSKIVQRIKKKQKLIQRNEWLVKLPHVQTKNVSISLENTFNIKEFIYMCRDYGLNRFRRNIEDWRKYVGPQ